MDSTRRLLALAPIRHCIQTTDAACEATDDLQDAAGKVPDQAFQGFGHRCGRPHDRCCERGRRQSPGLRGQGVEPSGGRIRPQMRSGGRPMLRARPPTISRIPQPRCRTKRSKDSATDAVGPTTAAASEATDDLQAAAGEVADRAVQGFDHRCGRPDDRCCGRGHRQSPEFRSQGVEPSGARIRPQMRSGRRPMLRTKPPTISKMPRAR